MRKLAARLGPGGKDGPEKEILLERLDDRQATTVRAVIDGVERIVEVKRLEGGGYWLLSEGRSYVVDVEPGKDGDLVVEVGGLSTQVRLFDPRLERLARAGQRQRASAGPEAVRAPMPGKVVKVLVKPGETVAANQGLVVVEAMKMENELRSPRGGKVQSVHVAEGQAVEAQEPLVTLE
jgi:pyruvate carboxylase subunit B